MSVNIAHDLTPKQREEIRTMITAAKKYMVVCKGLTVLVYFYSRCRYITTVAPFVHHYYNKTGCFKNDVRGG